ncbi:MAG: hypothetical protein ABI658_10140 [Acidimicrobiales bacterium]
MPIADPYKAALRQALVGAVETKLVRERRRARLRRAALAMAAIVAVVATVITVALPEDRAEATLEIDQRDGMIVVRLVDFENRPEQIVGALRNAGINAEVDPVPVGPSNVGHFVGSSSTDGGGLTIYHDTRFSFSSFAIPQEYKGLVRLKLGRRAAPGELWHAASDATAKGELLACRPIRGLTPAEATPLVDDAPATLSWLPAGGGPLAPGAELQPPYNTWRVVDALSPSAGLVSIIVTENGEWPYLTDPKPQVDPSCKGN